MLILSIKNSNRGAQCMKVSNCQRSNLIFQHSLLLQCFVLLLVRKYFFFTPVFVSWLFLNCSFRLRFNNQIVTNFLILFKNSVWKYFHLPLWQKTTEMHEMQQPTARKAKVPAQTLITTTACPKIAPGLFICLFCKWILGFLSVRSL